MRYPLDGSPKITTEYLEPGYGTFGKHAGIDWRASIGTPVYAPGGGVVTESYRAASGNQIVEIKIGNYLWRFLHLSERKVSKGDTVREGQLIAKSGNTGGVAPHLHVDVRKVGTAWTDSLNNYFDPRKVIDEANRAAPVAPGKTPKYIHLKSHVPKWAFYRPGTALPVKRANRAGELAPQKWGGITYPFVRWVAENTAEVTSPSLGTIWIYVDGDAEIRY